MISGYGPSGPLGGSGGNATRTSIGTPSKVLIVLRAVPPGLPAIVWSHRRTPLPCTAHGIGAGGAVNTLVMAAFAAGANARNAVTASAATTQRAAGPSAGRIVLVMPLLSRSWQDVQGGTEASRLKWQT